MQALLDKSQTPDGGFLEKSSTLAKIAISFLASIITIVLSSPEGLGFLLLASFCYAFMVPKLKYLLYAYLAIMIMFVIANFFGYLMTFILPIPFNTAGILVPFLRLMVMLNVVLPLAFSTRIQNILTSLKSLHLPFIIYLPAAVMIRFIPTFLHDIKQVAETLKIRGYKLSVLETMLHPMTMIRFLFTPLVFRSLRTSEELGIAGELKGMNPKTVMTKYKTEKWDKYDSLLMLLTALVMVLAVIIEVYLGSEGGGHR